MIVQLRTTTRDSIWDTSPQVCWCETNEKEKTKAIGDAEGKTKDQLVEPSMIGILISTKLTVAHNETLHNLLVIAEF